MMRCFCLLPVVVMAAGLLIMPFSFVASQTAYAATFSSSEAQHFIQQLSDDALETITNKKLSTSARTAAFRTLFLSSVDMDYVTRFVLGQAYKTSSSGDRADFQKAFENLVVATWSRRFDDYSGQTVTITNTTPGKDQDQIYVNSQVISPDKTVKPIDVVWRLRFKNNAYKIIDIKVEGVSMALSHRNEVKEALLKQDVSQLSEHYDQKASDILSGQADIS